MAENNVHDKIAQYYAGKLREHGVSPRGVDWNSTEAQTTRFAQLLKVVESEAGFSLNDIGCGYGALVDWMAGRGFECQYRGFDVAKEMIDAAIALHSEKSNIAFYAESDNVPPADYSVASGIFSVKMDVPAEQWEAYIADTLDMMASRSTKGFAFNLLTAYSDPDRQRPDLYYADPHRYFDLCRVRYARNVALLHDYGLYEFTLHVRFA